MPTATAATMMTRNAIPAFAPDDIPVLFPLSPGELEPVVVDVVVKYDPVVVLVDVEAALLVAG